MCLKLGIDAFVLVEGVSSVFSLLLSFGLKSNHTF